MSVRHNDLTIRRAWFLVDMTHTRYPDLVTLLRGRHKTYWPVRGLSIVKNDDATRAVIKVEGVNRAWREANIDLLTSAVIVRRFTVSDHDLVVDRLETSPSWSNTRRGRELT
jgi:hypothetical protein